MKKKLRLEFNYNSNHIEGNTLTYGQTQLLLLFDKSSGDASVSDIEEMKAHDLALSQIEEMAKDQERPLTELFIKELHEMILVKPYWKNAISQDGNPTRKKIEIGQYKTTPNSVRLKSGLIHEYASPEETPALMNDLLEWYNSKKDILHPVQLAAEFHYRFVCIHPFDDGNGRVARLIMNYILLRNNYPPVIIKSDDKENYLTALQKADTGDINSLIEYIEKQAIWSIELTLRAANGEDIDELDDIEKEIELLKREKLTTTTIYKTPKVIYELIKHIDEDLWTPINKVLGKFDDFFAESKEEKFVNHHQIKATKIIPSPLFNPVDLFKEKEVIVKKYEIFGYDLEEKDINEVEWSRKMLSLKSASKKIDHEITCSIQLYDAKYKLEIIGRYTNLTNLLKEKKILFEIENEYKIFFMSDSINTILRMISNHLIKEIKSEE
ncbi:MAG: Fic family protein [Bacteroidota bacterium]|nr:Fic family protein [Bacteroidota bacterium]